MSARATAPRFPNPSRHGLGLLGCHKGSTQPTAEVSSVVIQRRLLSTQPLPSSFIRWVETTLIRWISWIFCLFMDGLACWIRSGDGVEVLALGRGFGLRPSRGRLRLVGGSCAILGLLLLLTVQFLLVGFWIWSMGLSCLAGFDPFQRIVILALCGVVLFNLRLLALPVVEAVGGGVNLVAGNTYTSLWATLCCI